jgi:hypothetical protein
MLNGETVASKRSRQRSAGRGLDRLGRWVATPLVRRRTPSGRLSREPCHRVGLASKELSLRL